MSTPIHILGIAGSLRRASYNRAALRAATQLVPAGVTLDIFALDGIPGFNQDEELHPPAAKIVAFKRRMREADAILIVTPEYNYSVPGVLQNAIDWASSPYGDSAWSGKPVAIMGASVGAIGTARAQYHLRQTFVFLNMFPINQPEVMIGNAAERFDVEGHLTDETTKDFIRQLLQNLVAWTRRIGPPQVRETHLARSTLRTPSTGCAQSVVTCQSVHPRLCIGRGARRRGRVVRRAPQTWPCVDVLRRYPAQLGALSVQLQQGRLDPCMQKRPMFPAL
jgi:chromate reductase, NAD(P)H dehydrogenase (quinone)